MVQNDLFLNFWLPEILAKASCFGICVLAFPYVDYLQYSSHKYIKSCWKTYHRTYSQSYPAPPWVLVLDSTMAPTLNHSTYLTEPRWIHRRKSWWYWSSTVEMKCSMFNFVLFWDREIRTNTIKHRAFHLYNEISHLTLRAEAEIYIQLQMQSFTESKEKGRTWRFN